MRWTNMGTITVNVDDKTEKKFREAVKEKKGIGKGKLGSAISEAMNQWIKLNSDDEIAKRQIALMERGFDLGGITVKHRSELYERGV